MEQIDREAWKTMTNEQRYKVALKVRRRITRWAKKNPGKPLSEMLKLLYMISQRTIKKKGKYEEMFDLSGLGFKKQVTPEEAQALAADEPGQGEEQEEKAPVPTQEPEPSPEK